MVARIFGWKIILLFCLGTIGALALIALFIPGDPDTPTLPEELFIQEQAARLDPAVESDRQWQQAIVQATAGADADSSLTKIVRAALKAGAFNAASAAANLIQDASLRDKVLSGIATQALGECATLAWGAAALRAMTKAPTQLADQLAVKAGECGRR